MMLAMDTARSTEAVCRVLTPTPQTVAQFAQAAGNLAPSATTIALGALKAGGYAVCHPGVGLIPELAWSLTQRPR
jgi:hypothetical protein